MVEYFKSVHKDYRVCKKKKQSEWVQRFVCAEMPSTVIIRILLMRIEFLMLEWIICRIRIITVDNLLNYNCLLGIVLLVLWFFCLWFVNAYFLEEEQIQMRAVWQSPQQMLALFWMSHLAHRCWDELSPQSYSVDYATPLRTHRLRFMLLFG